MTAHQVCLKLGAICIRDVRIIARTAQLSHHTFPRQSRCTCLSFRSLLSNPSTLSPVCTPRLNLRLAQLLAQGGETILHFSLSIACVTSDSCAGFPALAADRGASAGSALFWALLPQCPQLARTLQSRIRNVLLLRPGLPVVPSPCTSTLSVRMSRMGRSPACAALVYGCCCASDSSTLSGLHFCAQNLSDCPLCVATVLVLGVVCRLCILSVLRLWPQVDCGLNRPDRKG